MPSERRMARINEAIRERLSGVIQEEQDTNETVLITILEVKTSVDVQWADVFVSIFPFEKRTLGMRYLEKNAPHFQRLLNKKLPLRHTPKIRFHEDYRMQLGAYEHDEEDKEEQTKGEQENVGT